MVDAVTWFEDDTPAQLIAACRPDVLAKARLAGRAHRRREGRSCARGRVVSSLEHERSTTALLQRIRGAKA